MIILDKWQEDFIKCQENKVLVAGRQTGKSEAQAWDNAEFALTHPGTTALIISKTERQAEELIAKVLLYLTEKWPSRIGKGRERPLKGIVWVTHKYAKSSRIMCLPVGDSAQGARGYTIHKLSIDEAQLPSDDVFNSLMPSLLTTGGKVSLTGTPQGKRGFFWKAFENKDKQWKVFRVNSEEVVNNRPINDSWTDWKKKAALDFLAQQKSMMSSKWYRQEFLAEFIEDLDQLLSDKQLQEICVLDRRENIKINRRYTIGVDVGRTHDPSTFEIFDGTAEIIEQVENLVRFEYPITATADEIINLDKKYGFEMIGVDGGGMGAGVVDILLREADVRRRTVDLNNAKRNYEWGEKARSKNLLKEDMYRNLITLVERGKVKLLKDESVYMSLKSCQIEHVEGSKEVLIHGRDTHVAEGIIRALWLFREKPKNIWIL